MIIRELPMSAGNSIHDICDANYHRAIRFQNNCDYAVVLASYYGGKGHTSHRTAVAAIKQAKKLQSDNYSFAIIDLCGNVYDVDSDMQIVGHIDFVI